LPNRTSLPNVVWPSMPDRTPYQRWCVPLRSPIAAQFPRNPRIRSRHGVCVPSSRRETRGWAVAHPRTVGGTRRRCPLETSPDTIHVAIGHLRDRRPPSLNYHASMKPGSLVQPGAGQRVGAGLRAPLPTRIRSRSPREGGLRTHVCGKARNGMQLSPIPSDGMTVPCLGGGVGVPVPNPSSVMRSPQCVQCRWEEIHERKEIERCVGWPPWRSTVRTHRPSRLRWQRLMLGVGAD
jgi:hypothetical protein